MAGLDEADIQCPYCGEWITILLDPQEAGECYIEDCQVCCQPMVLSVSMDSDDALSVVVRAEHETD